MTSRNLSDWDVLAVDENGRPTTGLFKTRRGASAYVKSNELWVVGADGANCIVDPGHLYSDDFIIALYEMPRDGIGFVCMSDDGWSMVGMSVYGWIDDRYIGIDEDDIILFRQLIQHEVTLRAHAILRSAQMISFEDALRYNQGDAYIAFQHGIKVPCSKPGKAQVPILRKALTCAMNERVA